MKTMPEIGKNSDGSYNLFKVSGDIAVFLLNSMREGDTLKVINREEKEAKPVHRKHRKHNHMKACPECGKACKGLQGLGYHRAKYHGYVSPNHDAYLKAVQRAKAKKIAQGYLPNI